MGMDCSYIVEHRSKSGEWECYGSPLEGWRDREVFNRFMSEWHRGLPADATFESRRRFNEKDEDGCSVYNCGVGWISYERWLRATEMKDIYHDKKHWDSYRVVMAFDN